MISIIYTYYNQYRHLHDLIELLNSYSPDIKNKIKLIFVDDNSKQTAEPILKQLDLKYNLYYIIDDIVWNNGGAKNLGLSQSDTDWNIVLDIDMFLTNNLLCEIIDNLNDKTVIYRLLTNERTNHWGGYDSKTWINCNFKSYPGSMIIERNITEKIGYFDEDFCGNYGYEDKAFFNKAKINGIKIKKLKTKNKLIHFLTNTDYNIEKTNTIKNKQLFEDKINNYKPWSKDILRFKWIKLQ